MKNFSVWSLSRSRIFLTGAGVGSGTLAIRSWSRPKKWQLRNTGSRSGFLFFEARFRKQCQRRSNFKGCGQVTVIEIYTECCCNQRLLPSEAWLDLRSFVASLPPQAPCPPGSGHCSPLCDITARGGTACMNVLPA